MSKTIAVCNNKGGVGKTHTVVHLSGALSDAGRRILAVDLDPQANLTRLFLGGVKRPTIFDVLTDQLPLREAVQRTAFTGLELAPADPRLEELGQHLINQPDQHIRLDTAIRERQSEADPYDLVLVDCPPNLGASTKNALATANSVIIPLEADQFSVDGLQRLIQLVDEMRRVNGRLMIEGVLISLYNGRRAIERTIAETLRTAAGVRVLDVFIRDSAKYREAITARQPITRYKPSSPQAEAFRELARIVEPSLGQQQEAFDVHHVHAGSH